jgi:hypothetical protein
LLAFALCLSPTWEKTCGLCLSDPGLLNLTWCPPSASIYLQTTWFHSSLWLSRTSFYIYIYAPHFLNPFISFRASE